MPSARTILTDYANEVGRNATATIQLGTDPGDDDYGPMVLVDDNPAQLAKINSTTGAWLLDFGTAQRIDLAAAIHHDFDESGGSPSVEVLIQANSSDSWTSPAFQAAFTVPPWLGILTGRWPQNFWLDLTVQPGYSATGWRYWRYLITDNSQNIQQGGLKLYSSFLQVTADWRAGWSRQQRKPAIVHRTGFQAETVYSRGTTIWGPMEGSLLLTTAQAEAWNAHWFNAEGRVRPFVLVPNGLRNVCYLVKRLDDPRETVQFYNESEDNELIEIPIIVEELGRGLRPGT